MRVIQQIAVVANSRTNNDGYRWWQHSLGWSVASHADETKIYMKPIDPATESGRNNTAVNTNTIATITLPIGKEIERPELFTRHPVALEHTVWVQYFGNTQFACNLQFDRDTTRQRMYFYYRGLHGGIDYGNGNPGVRIFAGMHGTITKAERNAKSAAHAV